MALISVDELAELLRQKLQAEIDVVKPRTTLELRLMAIRLAERLSKDTDTPEATKNNLYDAFVEMMGLSVKK